MYKTIYVPLDNSDHSNVSAELALSLSKQVGGTFVGMHAYAAALHDVRFKQMEFTLPDEYKDEAELEKQRRIHDSLIARGLTLISDSYLTVWQLKAAELDIPFEGKRFDGKNFEVIVDDIRASDYDLVILGALGTGAVKDSDVGSVCERVVRRSRVDALVVRDLESATPETLASKRGSIVVCLDGSPLSYGAVDSACNLARVWNKHVEIVVVSDPADAAHGYLLQHLEVARGIVREAGVSVSTTTLEGDPVDAIVDHAERVGAWLVACGRTGIDSMDDADADAADVGSVSERLIRRAPCNVLVCSREKTLPPAGDSVAALA